MHHDAPAPEEQRPDGGHPPPSPAAPPASAPAAAASPAGAPTASRDPGEVTLLLQQANQGSLSARERLLEIVYDELRVIARSQMRSERPDHTLGATGLVNESYFRLFRAAGETVMTFHHRHAFYLAAATAMRRILTDHARARAALKRSGGSGGSGSSGGSSVGGPSGGLRPAPLSVDVLEASQNADPATLLSLDDALSRLEAEDERAATVVRLRFYAGRQINEVAELLGVTPRTVKRDWEFARARLQELIETGAAPDAGSRADTGVDPLAD